MSIVKPVETDIDAEGIHRAIASTECQVGRDVACDFLAILIFTDGTLYLGVELLLELLHGSTLYQVTVFVKLA